MALGLIGLTSCNVNIGLQNLRKKFPTEEIVNVPGQKYQYLIRTETGEIYFMDSNGQTDPTAILLFPSQK